MDQIESKSWSLNIRVTDMHTLNASDAFNAQNALNARNAQNSLNV